VRQGRREYQVKEFSPQGREIQNARGQQPEESSQRNQEQYRGQASSPAQPLEFSNSSQKSYCSKTKLITKNARQREAHESPEEEGSNLRLNKSRNSPDDSQSDNNLSVPGLFVNNERHSFDKLPSPSTKNYSSQFDNIDFYSVRSQQQFRPIDYNGILPSSMKETGRTSSQTNEILDEGSNSIASGFNEERPEVLEFFERNLRNIHPGMGGEVPMIRPRHQSYNTQLRTTNLGLPEDPIRSRQRSFIKSNSNAQSSSRILDEAEEDKEDEPVNLNYASLSPQKQQTPVPAHTSLRDM
jgi:hypothetical protein